MILAAAGAVDHDKICAQAEQLFGHMKASPFATPEPARFQGGERRELKSLEQVHFTLAFESPSYRDIGIYTAQVFATALGGGMSSRLFQEIREKRGLCYSIFAQASAYADTGMTTIYAGTSGDQLAELCTITMEEIHKAVAGLSEPEIARARAQMKAGLLMGLESPSARAERLARVLSIWDRVPSIEETIANIEGVDARKLKDFGIGLATQSPLAMALYGPADKAPDIETLRSRLAA